MTSSAKPNPNKNQVTLDLIELYAQLRRELLIDRTPPPVVALPAVSTRAETSRLIADSLENDQTSVWLSTKADRERRRQRLRGLATTNLNVPRESSSDFGTTLNTGFGSSQGSALLLENARPIRIDPNLPGPQIPDRPSPQARERIKKLAMEGQHNPDLARDPYPIILKAQTFESYLAKVSGSVRLEVFDADEDDDTTICKLPNTQMLWDRGAHSTVITDDLLPTDFIAHARVDKYLAIYAAASNSSVVQVSIEIQFSNCVQLVEGVATIRPAGSLPNGFSGIILGQRTILDSLEYHVVPARVLRARGEDIEGQWGDIRLLGCVIDGQYEPS
jgi:hypothetical protein